MFTWLGTTEQGPFLALKNGLLDIGEVASGHIHLRDRSPLWFSTVAFPFECDGQAKCPYWLKFLDEVLEHDQQRIDLLQEWFGYLLTPDTTQHKFVVAEGEGANGKSVLLEVLTALLGPENVANVPLEMFGQRFQLTTTIHKLANVCAEVGEIDRVAEGFLKQFTAGDRMHFDRKFLSPVMAYPTARLILSTNNRPRFKDRSTGIWRRMIIVPFRVTIPPDRQDRHLADKLKEELPGVFQWALEGLARLRRNQAFTIPTVCEETLTDYRREINPARVFLEEACREDTRASVGCAELYKKYVAWCAENGFESLDERQFGKEVKRAFSRVERKRSSVALGRKWMYRGLSCLS
jgi:putative DNA primase/helicase